MFLKRIDILGFKSFADKTGVEFSSGITAVVGPNGSGKSNISDAIVWVLGEQSARSLRGSKMEDVIFSGSDSRKSINFCEVSLTLDNADHHLPVAYEEVTVTRRLYRSGDSEYLINQTTCRLRDIHELFMDSGLGRESYSIVGQGKIEQMLSTRPEDRRGPFEDAAGIVKFKFRRKEAERRLEETAANIVRVDDILAELEDQAGPLEKEAARAREYETLQIQLRDVDVSILLHDVSRMQERLHGVTEQVGEWTGRRTEAAAALTNSQVGLRQARGELERQTAGVETIQRRLMGAVEQRQRTEGDLALLQERLAGAQRETEDKAEQLRQLEAERTDILAQATVQRNRLQQLQGVLESKTAELEAAVHGVDPAVKSGIEAQIERVNSEVIEGHHQRATYRNEMKAADESLQSEERREARFTSELTRWQAEIDACTSEIALLMDKKTASEAALSVLSRRQNELGEALKRCVRDEAQATALMHQKESSVASLHSRLELLKDLEQGYDGYAQGVKTVLQAASKGRLDGVFGALAGLISVQREYEQAVETALGAAQQNILVATEAAARQAIAMLKSRQAGRATFMPLDVVKGRQLSDSDRRLAQTVDGFVGTASELVQTDVRFRVAVEHLLGNVLVARTLEAANEMARKLGYRVRVVTVDGDVVSPGGIMSGGSHTRKGPGLLGRTREQKDLAARLADTEQQLAEQRETRDALRAEAEQLQVNARKVENDARELRRAMDQCDASIREWRAKAEAAFERVEGLRWEQEQVVAGRTSWAARRDQAETKLAETELALAALEQELKDLRSALDTWDASVQQAQESMTSLKVEVATLTQERSSLKERIAELDLRQRRLNERKVLLQQELRAAQEVIAATQQSIEQGGQTAVETANLVALLEAELVTWRQGRQDLEAHVLSVEQQVQREQAVLTAAEEQVHRATAAVERTDLELNHLLERLGEQYQMTYEWASSHFEPALDLEASRRTADGLRNKIRALGDVRQGAIEEWERVSARMNFLSRERDDLLAARAQLTDVIGEIDEEMSKRFVTTFEQIKAEFQVMFKLLFNGGRADLTLTNPDDLLSTGIDVMAQPPGKRLQNLNLLSGGERALTAMALLFSILRVRPVPFCVLDEVEAALDEANVVRFAQQLRRFSDETQFIVITHRRGTMEEADALYGVTMQESGISTMISVRLDNEPETETA
ncbi:chromosome segregation protein SMC [Alicyclobacillus sp. ALC3]|uniref:chromosome segregation protein SMC n=1 Tax=Alicyclobacillus sp. ALC3 TaxID=2796143 RepID=UPI002379C65B|nr:chromosome segregation protein SMC [Alicyclobacillus sp. ALC3]